LDDRPAREIEDLRHLNPHAVLVSMLHAREPIVPPAFQATMAN
jgi:hypothetical protein